MELTTITDRIAAAITSLDIPAKEQQAAALESQTQKPDFWDDGEKAQQVFAELKQLQNQIQIWRDMEREARDLTDLEKEMDESLLQEWQNSVELLQTKLEQAELDLHLAGKYDRHNAILSLFAGTGGTDAQDWTEMLLRMYLRFCENQNWKAEIIAVQSGDEAGIKSATIEIMGENVFGYLRREKGTHRLIRLSPFNAKNLRQTSFAGVDITPVLDGGGEIEINEKDLRIDTYRSSGAGGQHVNTTDSAVRITHLPTGLVAACQSGRSQLQNREKAMQMLMGKLLLKKEEEEQQELVRSKGAKVAADFGSQIRTTTLHPYQQVKDHRTNLETSQTDKYLDGDLMQFVEAAMRAGF